MPPPKNALMCMEGLRPLWLQTSVSAGFGNRSCFDKITSVLLMDLPPLSPFPRSQGWCPSWDFGTDQGCWVVFAFCRTPLQGLLVLGGGLQGFGLQGAYFWDC